MLLACLARVPCVFALEAHLCAAFGACHKFNLVILGDHLAVAARFRAVAQERVLDLGGP